MRRLTVLKILALPFIHSHNADEFGSRNRELTSSSWFIGNLTSTV